MKNDLIERYIYAVTKGLDPTIRQDVSAELHGLIDDMLTERCGAEVPAEKDVRVVLTELGSPQELHHRYNENAQKCLIGQPYYNTYRFVLKIAMGGIAVSLTIACILLQIVNPQTWFEAVGFWFSILCDGVVSCYAAVTVIFSLLYTKGLNISSPFRLDDLPPVPKKNQLIPTWEPVASILFIAVFLVVFLAVPQLLGTVVTEFGIVSGETGVLLPFFDVTKLRARWYIPALFALSGILRESVKLTEKRYNKTVLRATLATDLVSAFLCLWWLSGHSLINPLFLENIHQIFPADGQFLSSLFHNFNGFFLAVMLLALALDAVTALRKTDRT